MTNVLHLNASPRVRAPLPGQTHWVVVFFSFILAALGWPTNDLWRIATWDRHQLEMDGTIPRDKLLILAVFGAIAQVVLAAIFVLTCIFGWEWLFAAIAPGFLYFVATIIRLG